MKKIIIIMLLCIVTSGCAKTKKLDLEKILEKNNYIIVDVRTSEEYYQARLKDSINIPYDQINDKIDLDKDKTILVYCQSGNRSKIAYEKLEDLGYKVYDLGAFGEIDLPHEK